jgi:hypothetical protein
MPKFERITLIIESLPGARAQVQVDIPTPMPGMRLETPAHALAIDALGWLGKQPAVAGFVYSDTTPSDPMDWPLPCDVVVGHCTIGKGVKLRTLVLRMKGLYQMAHGRDADEVAARTPEQRSQLLANFQALVATQAATQEMDALTPAAHDVLLERRRQIHVEGWTAEHDDMHYGEGELSDAAVAYATDPYCCTKEIAPPSWPWTADWWKPSTARRDLVKAAALLIAEIDRLDRAAQKAQEQAA